ncbi:MAG: hypothetical protein WBX10_16200, partial [Candidatus Sulfotelmatobacter sp.]
TWICPQTNLRQNAPTAVATACHCLTNFADASHNVLQWTRHAEGRLWTKYVKSRCSGAELWGVRVTN